MAKPTISQLSNKKKKAIFKVCLSMFSSFGYANTSMKRIASRLRVADGFLYYYFTGKEDLTIWVMEGGLEIWKNNFQKNVMEKNPENLFELFKLSVLQMSRFIHEERDLYGMYYQFVNEPGFPLADTLVEGSSWIDKVYMEAIEQEMKSGYFRKDISSDMCAMIMDVVNTRIQEFIFNPKLDPIGISSMDETQLGSYLDNMIHLFKDGMVARESS